MGSITKRGSAMARFLLGQMVLHALRKDSYLKNCYKKIRKRRGPKTHAWLPCDGCLFTVLRPVEEVSEFIRLHRLNRRMVVLMDRDKPKGGIPGMTKKRVQKELEGNGGLAWITQGREIENYLPLDWTITAVKETQKKKVKPCDNADSDKRLQYDATDGTEKAADKIKVAKWIVEKSVDWSVLDLKKMVSQTVKYIQESNGIEQP